MTDREKALEALRQVSPSRLDYQDWLSVGMALHSAACSCEDWDSWSRGDAARYHAGQCKRKWDGFKGSGVGLGTLFKLCLDHGGRLPESDRKSGRMPGILEDDSFIGGQEPQSTVADWTESHGMPQPPGDNWNPADDLRRYLQALFEPDEHVGYVVDSWKTEDGRRVPCKGNWGRTSAELIAELQSSGGDLANVLGEWDADTGAWIRFNPLDGKGIQDSNVTSFRFALVESDSLPLDRQYDLYRQLELPIAALVYSGGKSVHAIVRIEAPTMEEYRQRVDYLYATCKKSGMEIDRQNRNPSRLSRLPGAIRNGKRQYLIETGIGKGSWQEWRDWVEEQNDELPDPESLAATWDNLPPLADEVIGGVLREGHKMLIAGPSKAAKSFMLIKLTAAIAEGRSWLGFKCKRGRVLYINLELDRASCLHRFKDVYQASGWAPEHMADISIWNLRGKAMPMDKLAPKLIRRAKSGGYVAVIIDPIYKVITGDENSASEMAKFCNEFDRICDQLGTATIYCHHHSKGSQGQKQASDRASGSGVFARDPDACLDIIELKLDARKREVIADRAACDATAEALDRLAPHWKGVIPEDDALVWPKLEGWLTSEFNEISKEVITEARKAQAEVKGMSAWRIEGTLREFPSFAPRKMFFRYPVHIQDAWDVLDNARAEGELPARGDREAAIAKKIEEAKDETLMAFEAVADQGRTTVKEMAEYLGMTERGLVKRLSKVKTLKREKGFVFDVRNSEPEHTSKVPSSGEAEE